MKSNAKSHAKKCVAFLLQLLIPAALTLASSAHAATAISPKDAAQAVTAGSAILVDVRELAELKESGKAKPAKWLATSEIEQRSPLYKNAVSSWSKSTNIIFYCRSGNRSGKAADHFQSLGFKTLNAGAFQAWKDAGLPVEPVTK